MKSTNKRRQRTEATARRRMYERKLYIPNISDAAMARIDISVYDKCKDIKQLRLIKAK